MLYLSFSAIDTTMSNALRNSDSLKTRKLYCCSACVSPCFENGHILRNDHGSSYGNEDDSLVV